MTDKTARILRKNKFLSTFRPLSTIKSSLRSVKGLMDPKNMKCVYVIPCSFGTTYVGESGCSINQRIQEHAEKIKHGRTHSLALAEHVEKRKHHIFIEDARVIARIDHFHHGKFREAIEIERMPSNLNKDNGWKISCCWSLSISF